MLICWKKYIYYHGSEKKINESITYCPESDRISLTKSCKCYKLVYNFRVTERVLFPDRIVCHIFDKSDTINHMRNVKGICKFSHQWNIWHFV